MQKKVIIIVLLVIIGIVFLFYKISIKESDYGNDFSNINSTKNISHSVVYSQECSFDRDCKIEQFCAFSIIDINNVIGNCSTISETEGKSCSKNSDCDYGYLCGRPIGGAQNTEEFNLSSVCWRMYNPKYPPV